MPPAIASALATLLTAYVGAGALFAAAFVTLGAGRVDSRAAGAGWGFRVLILPGSILLWPWLALRWAAAGRHER